jgi:lipopolysaccharide export system protein LptA
VRATLSALAALLAAAALTAEAQVPGQERCDFVFTNTPATRINVIRLPSGAFRTYLGAGVVAHCAGQDNQIAADSAEHHEDIGQLFLIDNVRYREPRATVTSSRMTYFQAEERLNAEGNVVATMANGTVMRGPVADYYRVSPFRATEILIGTGRPQLTLAEQSPTGQTREPVVVHADRIQMEGDSLVYASGRVDISRTDVLATSDSAFVDSGRELVRLIRNPRVMGRGEQRFTLQGDVIDLYSRERQLERVVATPNGHATSEDMELFADSIDLRLSEERINRAMAWGASRARAVSTERDILADSLDVIMPSQQIEEVRAIGSAYATSIPDRDKVISAERDWLEGDTIVVEFEAAGTEQRTRARQLTATVDARSFHQMEGRTGHPEQPSVNYVRGETIIVIMADGELSYVIVEGEASGVYVEWSDQPDAASAGRDPSRPGTTAPGVAPGTAPATVTPPRPQGRPDPRGPRTPRP